MVTVMVMVANADLVASATEVAVRVTVAGFGTLAGAVYVTGLAVVLLRVPHVGEQATPPCVRLQVTFVLGVFCTVAVNCCAPFTGTLADVGDTETLTGGGGVTVTMAVPDLVESATEVAVTVTVAGVGTVAGAV